MSIKTLLMVGSPDRGNLEKFADGCNVMARALFAGRTVTLAKSDKNDYTFQTNGDGRSFSACWWEEVIGGCLKLYAIGLIPAVILAIPHLIACIPTTICMGIGLAAKKIALATDKNARAYQSMIAKRLTLAQQNQELKTLEKKIESKTTPHDGAKKSKKRKNKLRKESTETKTAAQGKELNGLDLVIQSRENEIKNLKKVKKIEKLESDKISRITVIEKLKNEVENDLKKYLTNKNEKFNNINLLDSSDISITF